MLTRQEYTAAVARYLDMVYRPACSSLSLAAGAEDAAQETIEKQSDIEKLPILR